MAANSVCYLLRHVPWLTVEAIDSLNPTSPSPSPSPSPSQLSQHPLSAGHRFCLYTNLTVAIITRFPWCFGHLRALGTASASTYLKALDDEAAYLSLASRKATRARIGSPHSIEAIQNFFDDVRGGGAVKIHPAKLSHSIYVFNYVLRVQIC